MPVVVQEVLNNPGRLLGIAGILLFVGSLGSWYSGPTTSGWDAGIGKISFFISLIFLATAATHLGYIRHPIAHPLLPMLSISSICGFIALITCLVGFDLRPNYSWGLLLSTVGALAALFAAYKAYTLRV